MPVPNNHLSGLGGNELLTPFLNSSTVYLQRKKKKEKRKSKKGLSRIHGDFLVCGLHSHMVSGCSELYIAVTLESLGVANEEVQRPPIANE